VIKSAKMLLITVTDTVSVRLSATFVYSIKTSKHIIKLFSQSGTSTILVFSTTNVMAIWRRGPPDAPDDGDPPVT